MWPIKSMESDELMECPVRQRVCVRERECVCV